MTATHSRREAPPATRVEPFHGDNGADARRLAQTQTLMREVNEQIHQLTNRFDGRDLRTVICECAEGGCAREIRISPRDYERVRSFPARFIAVPGHEKSSIERVVETHAGYVVVEKIGIGAETAIRMDPRRRR